MYGGGGKGMEYINLPVRMFHCAEFIGAEPVDRATWISLLCWCCAQENGGVIVGCSDWGTRRWMQTCGVTAEEVRAESALFRWDGDNLIVFGYPQELQDALKARRDASAANGRLGGRPRKKPSENLDKNLAEKTQSSLNAYTELFSIDKKPRQKPSKNLDETQQKPSVKPSHNLDKNLAKSVRKVSIYNNVNKNICSQEITTVNITPIAQEPTSEQNERAPEHLFGHDSEKRTESTLETPFNAEPNNLPCQTQNKQEGGKEFDLKHIQQAQRYPERLNDVTNAKFAENEVCMGNTPETARFMAACLSIHPSWNRTIPTAIEQAAALEAYRSAAGKISQRDIDLLKAYYASTLTSDQYGVRFWRPDSRKSFWNNFGDIIAHADRWAKETHWRHPKDKKKNLLQPKPEEGKTTKLPIIDREEAVREIASLNDLIGKPVTT